MTAKSTARVIQWRTFPCRNRELRATGVSPWRPLAANDIGTERLTEGGGDFKMQVPLGHHPWSVRLCNDPAIWGPLMLR